MYLKSISMKGFKSFPERARLEFSPGVSVIVGPNGSGKSNITDAVLWALGEQSPGAIRGASMQDVISAGGKGVGQRRAATEFSEISVERRLDRSGDSGYRLNGARAHRHRRCHWGSRNRPRASIGGRLPSSQVHHS